MADIEHQITIARPVSEVYNAITDFENADNLKQWQPTLISVGVTAGNPLRAGTMIAMSRRFFGSKIFVNLDVMENQRNKRFEVKGIHGRFPFRREIECSPSGRETVINDSIFIKGGWLFFWWIPFVRGRIRKQTAQEWQNLKAMLEESS